MATQPFFAVLVALASTSQLVGCAVEPIGTPPDASIDATTTGDAAVDADVSVDAARDDGAARVLSFAMESADYVAVGGCVEVVVTLLDEAGLATTPPDGLEVALTATAELSLSLESDCSAGSSAVDGALSSSASTMSVYARGLAIGSAEIAATSAAVAPAVLGIEVAPAFDFEATARGALVLHNTNVPEALALARYYADARGIDASHICGVALPPGTMATADELLGARRTIVESCICPLIDLTVRPEPCVVARASDIAAVSPITHLVTTKGMPTRLTETGWTLDEESPSLAPFLSYLIYHDDAIFGDDTKRSLAPLYPRLSPASYAPPPVDPAELGWAAWGQIEATTFARTRALIDRTLAAERDGFRGNILIEDASSTPLWSYLRELTQSFDPTCTDYLTHTPFVFGTPESSWPYARCRVGTTGSTVGDAPSGSIPGELGTTIPNPVSVGLFLGANPGPNTQTGFDGFDVMRRWHRDTAICNQLCLDRGPPAEIARCQASSVDIFGELDSECVGAAPGFLAFQLRSWPVQHMGFFPSGWAPVATGAEERDAPRVLTGGAYRDARFTDDAYVRFGGADFEAAAPAGTPQCQYEDGTTHACEERVVTAFGLRVPIDPPLPFVSGRRSFTVRMRYRNAASPGGALVGWGVFDGVGTQQWEVGWTLIDAAHPSWTLHEFPVVADQSRLPGVTQLEHMYIYVIVSPDKPALGYLDLDGIEVVDDSTGRALLRPSLGSFAETSHEENVPGDFAANVIDRMGGIGAWGSSSHFITGGWAFRAADRFAPMLFSGRTVGEALLAAERPQSGLVYADPLYRPVAIRLSAHDGASVVSVPRLDTLGDERFLHATAMLGRDHAPSVAWTVASCEDGSIETCERESRFTVVREGVGAIEDLAIDWTELVALSDSTPVAVFRLTVLRPGIPDEPFSSYVRVQYRSRP